MKNIAIAGIGIGENSLTREAVDAITRAEVLIGAQGVLETVSRSLKIDSKPSFPCYSPADVARIVTENPATDFAVLVSGDVGFYSAAAGISKALGEHNVRYVPGVSAVVAFFAKLKMPWQDAALVSAHGRRVNVADCVRRNRLTFCLTGNNTAEIGYALAEAGLEDIPVHIGENIGSATEKIYTAAAGNLPETGCPSHTVLLFVNERYDDRVLSGIPDHRFIRAAGIPMTKSEIRAVILSRLRLRPGDIFWDIGAGTGSVTVEAAFAVYRGGVYAVERREDAARLIQQNVKNFHLGNVTLIQGEAPAALETLPCPGAVFIGGSGGEMLPIISAVLRKSPQVRLVITAITVETVAAAVAALEGAGMEAEILQINAARGKKINGLHRMEAQNPVTVISAGGDA
ncbi:MAG: precorrin-6Y C5,15-methyltransferase (decarboxylating) subunit CbiT [Clostridiales bacterium]|jgi:precorrin-6Y C5,15-methyltransferase (decarboxylating)|nr:precorrin-6Y C5,15-methyltransferase (decarboxylating) subunit CbiT [Clostridiales bacterium]